MLRPMRRLARIDVGDLGLDRIADVEELRRLVDALGRELAHVDQALEPFFELDEDAEVGDAGDRAAARGRRPG